MGHLPIGAEDLKAPNLSLTQMGDDYLTALLYEHGRSPKTLTAYRAALRKFHRWLVAAGLPDDASSFNPATCRAYLYSLQKRGCRPRTIRSAFHPIRGLGRYAVGISALPESPVAALSMPKLDAAKRLLVSDDEIVVLLKATRCLYPSRWAALAEAMLYALIFGGMRFQEWIDIKMCDVSISTGSILIAHGKGEKSRTLYPTKECMAKIQDWIAIRGECEHDWLWSRTSKNRMGGVAVRDLLEEVKSHAGLEGKENIKPHSLRHAFASRMLRNGASLKVIQAALGHSDLLVTQGYLHLNEEEAKRMAEFASINPGTAPPTPAPKENVYNIRRGTAEQFNRMKRNRGR